MADLTVSNDIDNFMQSANNTDARTNLGLGNVDNIADADKPVSTAQQAADNRRAFAGGVVVARTGSSSPQLDDQPWPVLGTGDFSIVWDGATVDTTVATKTMITAVSGSNALQISLDRDAGNAYDAGSVKLVIGANTYLLDAGTDVFETKSVWIFNFDRNGNATLYQDGSSIATVDISSSSAVDLDSTTFDLFYRNSTGWLARGFSVFNCGLSAAEAAELSEIGLGAWLAKYPEDKYAGEEGGLTSGTLTVGKRYRINTFETGDDFTNVGAASNATGIEFVATSTTPTTWTNSSELEDIGALAAYPMNEGNGRQLRDLSGRYDAMLSETGYQHLQPKNEGYVRVKAADASSAIYMLEASDIIPADSVITDIIAEERKVSVANTAQDLADNRIRLNPSGSDLQIQRSDGSTHDTLGTVTAPTSLSDIDAEIHFKQQAR